MRNLGKLTRVLRPGIPPTKMSQGKALEPGTAAGHSILQVERINPINNLGWKSGGESLRFFFW
jgi:hypothetical protein